MSATTCYIHPAKAANTSCERCHRPICPADHRSFSSRRGGGMGIVVQKKLVCPECYNILKAKEKSRTRLYGTIGFIMVGSIIGFFLYMSGFVP